MKKLLLPVFCIFFFISNAQEPFITTWEVTDDDLEIMIPADESTLYGDFTYDYTVDFGDGTVLANQDGTVYHTYLSAGIYTVSISGTFPRFNGEALSHLHYDSKFKSIEQWGDIQWLNVEAMFFECESFNINASDAPDLSQVTSMAAMFLKSDSFNSDINHWDVSTITNMSNLFKSAYSFNQPLNNWDVSSVTNMSSIFESASSFNQSLANWDVSNVTSMRDMFLGASSFNQPIDDWDVSSVVSMREMFKFAGSFNMPLNSWDVSNVNDMQYMFYSQFSPLTFNQPLDNWDVSSVTNMRYMFANAKSFNQNINDWDVSNVTNMSHMFEFTDIFNQPLNNWDVSSVIDMSSMFKDANLFNQPLDNWDVSSVTNMSALFYDATAFNQDISSWDVSSTVYMNSMFFQATLFNQPLNNWDVSNVEEMNDMFRSTDQFNQNINDWDVSNVIKMGSMFSYALAFNKTLDQWDISSVQQIAGMFNGADSFNQSLFNWEFNTSYLQHIISYSGMDSENYDLLLTKLALLGLEDGYLGAIDLNYCNVIAKQQLQDRGWYFVDEGLADDCEINYLSGNIQYDFDANGCSPIDFPLSKFLVGINDGENTFATPIDEDGNYSLIVNSGDYTISILNLDSNFYSSPISQTVSFNGENEIIEDIDFCVIANQQFEDLSIDIFPLDDAIPGFETDYQIIVTNNGTQTVESSQITFAYDSNFQSFVSSTQAPFTNTTDLLTYEFDDVEPFSSKILEITMLNVVPPALNSGDILTFTAQVTPVSNDTTPDDNTVILEQTVVNSFDPNDKMVVQGDEITDENIDQYLDYRIRFQNLGTANALNVKITDTISDKLDWTTFQPISSSHDYRIEIVYGEQINYYFDNINLPYEDLDEEGSNGYIAYKIKPKSTVQIGDVIENTAYIYFDFNLPIVTNTVTTTIVDVLNTDSFELNKIKVYPNPTVDVLYLDFPSSLAINSVKLFDVSGKLVKLSQNETSLSLGDIKQGLYILKIETDKGVFIEKILKR